jgi:hypothetical protein
VKCPHCDKHISSKLVRSAAAKLNRAKQTTPNPKILSPFPRCGELKVASCASTSRHVPRTLG